MNRLPETLKQFVKRVALPSGARPYRVRSGALKGKRFWFDLQQDTQVWRGVYEQELQRWVELVVHSGSVCLDVGAAEGWVTLQMALRATSGETHAFEPSERGDWIEKNLALNDSEPLGAVIVERAMVGSGESPAGSEHPPMVSLDGYVERRGLTRVDVLKIDVDGPELDVLDGAQSLLQRYRPAVCVEAHSRDLCEGVVCQLSNTGYETRVVDPPPHEHRPLEYNPTVFAWPAPPKG